MHASHRFIKFYLCFDLLKGGLFGFFYELYSTLFHLPPLRGCQRMLGSNQGLLRTSALAVRRATTNLLLCLCVGGRVEGGRAAWVPRSPAPIPATPRREEEEGEEQPPTRHARPRPTLHATSMLETQVRSRLPEFSI
jgi:hypothetical protein